MRVTSSRQILVPLVVACAMFMQNLDSTVIATALPTIAGRSSESPLRLNVAITCYLLSLAVFIPISGWTADRFGARRVFSSAIVVFTLGSIACGVSHSLPALVAARILQGIGGAMMVPVGRLVLLRTVPKSDLVRAMSFVSVPALIGPVMGPPVGGLIVTYASWRWIFFINIPIGVLGIVLVNLLIGDLKETGRRPFDLSGFALTGIGLASLAFGFENVGRGALPNVAVIGIVGRRRGLPRALCAPRASRLASDHRSRPVEDPDLRDGLDRRLSVSHGARRIAVPVALDASGRVRPQRAELGAVDLRQRRRGDADEDVGGARYCAPSASASCSSATR